MGGRRGGGGVFKWVERLGLASRSSSALAFNASLGSMSPTPLLSFPLQQSDRFCINLDLAVFCWLVFVGLC